MLHKTLFREKKNQPEALGGLVRHAIEVLVCSILTDPNKKNQTILRRKSLKSPLSTGTLTIELGCMLGSALKMLLRDVSSPSGFRV